MGLDSRGRDSDHAQCARHPRRMTTTHSSAPSGIADDSTRVGLLAGRGRLRVVAEGFAGSIFAHILPTFSRETEGIGRNKKSRSALLPQGQAACFRRNGLVEARGIEPRSDDRAHSLLRA